MQICKTSNCSSHFPLISLSPCLPPSLLMDFVSELEDRTTSLMYWKRLLSFPILLRGVRERLCGAQLLARVKPQQIISYEVCVCVANDNTEVIRFFYRLA